MGELQYDYGETRRTCDGLGLRFDEAALPMADQRFAELGLSQAQVDGVMGLHAWIVGWRFNPGAYSLRQRFALALHFLFGRANPAFQRKGEI
jgi:hypothetical protein